MENIVLFIPSLLRFLFIFGCPHNNYTVIEESLNTFVCNCTRDFKFIIVTQNMYNAFFIVTLNAALYLTQLDVPLFTFGAHAGVISNKSRYKTVVRVGTAYKHIGSAFVKVCFYF